MVDYAKSYLVLERQKKLPVNLDFSPNNEKFVLLNIGDSAKDINCDLT